MIKKSKHVLLRLITAAVTIALCMLALTVAFTACDEKPVDLVYVGSSFTATAGVSFAGSAGTATGAENITYALKEGSVLPAGLTMSSDGKITGTPASEAREATFEVVATAGKASATAKFTITVFPAGTVLHTLVCEAEYADLTKMDNIAPSYAPIIFFTNEKASNGMYLGDLGYKNNTIKFAVTAAADAAATMEIAMSSCIIGSLFECGPDVMEIRVNGKPVAYDDVDFGSTFTTFAVEIELVGGENAIEFITTDNKKVTVNGVPVMPNFDYIKLTSEAELDWTPNTDNEDIY